MLDSEAGREKSYMYDTWGCTDNKPKKYRTDDGVSAIASRLLLLMYMINDYILKTV